MAFDFSSLPRPQVVEDISFDAILARRLADIKQRFLDAGINYDVGNLETDPVMIQLEGASYAESILRARINDAAREFLLPISSGGDLDYLAAFYDVTRMVGELDARLRERVVLAIKGRSTGGTEPRYKFVAMSADIRVKDVSIYTVGRSPIVHAAVFSTDNNGIADQILIDKVNAALQDSAVRMVNDIIEVGPAASTARNVAANAWLLPSAPASTIAAMETALRNAWIAEMALGRDITRSWLYSKLMVAGVQRVEIITPATDIVVPFNEAAGLGTITIVNMGRDF